VKVRKESGRGGIVPMLCREENDRSITIKREEELKGEFRIDMVS
jgi:hypothetical protein